MNARDHLLGIASEFRAMPSAPATRASHRTNLRCFGHSASVRIADDEEGVAAYFREIAPYVHAFCIAIAVFCIVYFGGQELLR